MSTSATIPNPNTVAAPAIKNELVTFAVVVELNSEGKIDPKKVRHTSSEKDIAALEAADYKGIETIAFKQVVNKPSLGSETGFADLITDPEVRLDIINKGIASKFNQKIRTTLIELDEAGNLAFQPVEPSYDATALVQEAALRTNMSPTDKAIKMLANLPEDMRAAILAQFAKVGQATDWS